MPILELPKRKREFAGLVAVILGSIISIWSGYNLGKKVDWWSGYFVNKVDSRYDSNVSQVTVEEVNKELDYVAKNTGIYISGLVLVLGGAIVSRTGENRFWEYTHPSKPLDPPRGRKKKPY